MSITELVDLFANQKLVYLYFSKITIARGCVEQYLSCTLFTLAAEDKKTRPTLN